MPSKPSDTPTIRKLLEELNRLSLARSAVPALKPFFAVANVDIEALTKILDSTEDLSRHAMGYARTLDRFNELFASRGWLAYDLLNLETAQEAVAVAEAGNMAQAEDLLVRYYCAEQVAAHLHTLRAVKAFRARMRLAELALIDYKEGRYHASTPVVLALLDGMVNELGNRGFFSSEVDLTAWDSIAAHDRGLAELKQLLFKQRAKTTSEPLDMPFRNGILHGMDLGYDTPLVAAKSWAALFATADWARKVEQGKKNEPPSDRALTLPEAIVEWQKIAVRRARIDAWRPREGVCLTDPEKGSPEASLRDFLDAWVNLKYGVMARWLAAYDKKPLNQFAGEVRRYYEHLVLDEFTILAACDQAAAVTEVQVRGRGTRYGSRFDRVATFRLVKMDENRNPVIHGDPGGTWFVMNWDPW